MVSDEIVERLRTLEVFPDTPEHPNTVRESAEIFEKCTTLDDIGREAAERHWGCGSEQFVHFYLGALLEHEPEYKSKFLEEAKRQFGELGILPEHIEEYFQYSGSAGLVFTLRYEEQYSADVRMNFYEKADQFALNKMKEWLGIQSKS